MSGTRWLSDDEQRIWRSYLEATQLLTEVLGRELAATSGLSMGDYELLVRLSEAPGRRLRMSSLAEQVLASRSRLSHAVGRLESSGLVAREACPTDRRGSFAVLTAAGLDAVRAAAPGHVTSVRAHLFDQLDADAVAALGQACQRLAHHLRTAVPGGADVCPDVAEAG